MIDLDLLRAFLAVYRHLSVTKAATALAVSQSAMSGRIHALEARLGKRLFRRQGRGLQATAQARALARSVGPYIDGLESVLEGFRHQGKAIAGSVRIAGPEEYVERFVIPSLTSLTNLGIRPTFSFEPAEKRIDALKAGDLDLAIMTTRTCDPAIATGLLHREHYLLIAAARWADAVSDNVEAAIEGGFVPLLAYADSLPMIRRYWIEVFGREISAHPPIILPGLRTLLSASLAGLGATVLPDYLCEHQIATGQLVADRAMGNAPTNDIELAWRRGRQHPRNLVARDILLKTAKIECT